MQVYVNNYNPPVLWDVQVCILIVWWNPQVHVNIRILLNYYTNLGISQFLTSSWVALDGVLVLRLVIHYHCWDTFCLVIFWGDCTLDNIYHLPWFMDSQKIAMKWSWGGSRQRDSFVLKLRRKQQCCILVLTLESTVLLIFMKQLINATHIAVRAKLATLMVRHFAITYWLFASYLYWWKNIRDTLAGIYKRFIQKLDIKHYISFWIVAVTHYLNIDD